VLCDIEGQPAAFRQEGFSPCRSGSMVQLDWSLEDVHRFDKKSGVRLDEGTATLVALAVARP
jgi:hypothetical protein